MTLDRLFDTALKPQAEPAGSITIRRPDDWHIHLRDDAMLRAVLPFTAAQFARGIIMPNLVPPVTSIAAAEGYRERILAARPTGSDLNGARFYGLTPNAGTIDLHRRAGRVPAAVAVDDDEVVIFRGEETLPWSIGEVRP
jgi:dihydroorotase